jgi:hypothetical protein
MRKTTKLKMTGLALGLGLMAMMQANNGNADPSCEQQCFTDYQQCQEFCGRNPCFVACETNYDNCLANCGSTQ